MASASGEPSLPASFLHADRDMQALEGSTTPAATPPCGPATRLSPPLTGITSQATDTATLAPARVSLASVCGGTDDGRAQSDG